MAARPTIAAVKAAVAESFGVPLAAMTTDARDYAVAHPRQAAMALAYRLTGRGSAMIGRHFGGRDHATVLHACVVVEARRRTDPTLDHRLARLERALADAPEPPARRPELQLAFLDGPLFDLAGVPA